MIEEETTKRVEEELAKRVQQLLYERKDEIEAEVLRRVEEAKKVGHVRTWEEFFLCGYCLTTSNDLFKPNIKWGGKG